MKTNLPDFPFTNYAKAELNPFGTHSSAKSSARKYPRTDLKTFTHWASFPEDIHRAVQSATTRANLHSTPFTVEAPTKTMFVENEEKLRAHAVFALHNPVEEVLDKLGVKGMFTMPGSRNVAIVGDLDFSWVTNTQSHPKVIAEYKTWWAANLVHIVAAFSGTRSDTLSKQSLDALQQIYRYMTFNNNKFGILTNWQRALFLRHAETSDCKTLEYYLIELDGPILMLKVWVGMVLLAEDNWFYASPTISSPPPDRHFRNSAATWKERKKAAENVQEYHMLPINNKYQHLPLDFCLCCFDLSSVRCGEKGCVVTARLISSTILKNNLHVVCKVVDGLCYPNAANLLDNEARTYTALQNLQGKAIPTLYGFYEVWGILQLLALEPVGNAIFEGEEINQSLRKKMKVALQHIHNAGYIHGDIARRNFCSMDSGNIFLVDLETCRLCGNPSELVDEMNEVDRL
ncbi:hypothetical protein PILCRDRAFT_59694 [Piloderma croceum F 1598]|uniref:Protein kinase domain-containing protein n=1 Tax=Piloderma croceum (strain F 1598) TaxID=765440 RepID=A0A0C3G256_PILCF|nr:hypothetical protein PILCRDRAFT_59694 [Piloderma croceum F 1598]